MTLTHYIVLATFAAWIWYTSVSRQNFGAPTISQTLRNIAWTFSLFPFIWGMLISHWFAPRQSLPSSLWGWGVGLPLMAILLTYDLYWLFSVKQRTWYRWPMWYFLLGLPVGYWFWPQRSLESPF